MGIAWWLGSQYHHLLRLLHVRSHCGQYREPKETYSASYIVKLSNGQRITAMLKPKTHTWQYPHMLLSVNVIHSGSAQDAK